MLSMAQNDLRLLGIAERVVKPIADPINETHVREQLQMLETDPASYTGVYIPNGLVGYAYATEHLASDERYYTRPLQRLLLPALENEQSFRLSGNPLGIFAVCVAHEARGVGIDASNRILLANDLVGAVVGQNEATHGDIRIGLHADDPFKSVFERNGFERTRKVAKIAGVALRQYMRPSKSHS